MHVAPSARLLRKWLDEKNLTIDWLAKALGTSQSTVYRWTTAEFRPEAHFRMAIESLTQAAVPFDGWFLSEELELARLYDDEKMRRRALRQGNPAAEHDEGTDPHEQEGLQ